MLKDKSDSNEVSNVTTNVDDVIVTPDGGTLKNTDKNRMLSEFWLPLLFACSYGAASRYIFQLVDSGIFPSDSPFKVMTISFLLFVPFGIGAIAVYLRNRRPPPLTFTQMFFGTWPTCIAFCIGLFVFNVEGLICIVLAMPVFLIGAGIGGMIVGGIQRYFQKGSSTVLSLAVLPFLLAPVEHSLFNFPAAQYTIKDEIIIHKPADVVWKQLGTVATIAENEWHSYIAQPMGIPRPLKADMSHEGVGGIRTSTWDKGVTFQEHMTLWEENRQMYYDFVIDPNNVPIAALDEHVKLGGEYFSPLTGGYQIEVLSDGSSKLTITTVVRDNTHFGFYSKAWGQLVFHDFHNGLLQLIKHRAES